MTNEFLLGKQIKEEKKNLNIGERIEMYEKLESSLKKFFDSTNFCYDHCFSKEEAVIGWMRTTGDVIAPGNEGCCHDAHRKFYDFAFGLDFEFDITSEEKETFQEKQLENIREDFCQTGTCDYHTDSGCAIEKLRSPKCNSWICGSYEVYLSSKFNIQYSGKTYSDNSAKGLLGIIFDKKIDINQINETISNLERATKRIKGEKEQTFPGIIIDGELFNEKPPIKI